MHGLEKYASTFLNRSKTATMAAKEVNGPSLATLASFPAVFGAVPPTYTNALRHVNIPHKPNDGGGVSLRSILGPAKLARPTIPAK